MKTLKQKDLQYIGFVRKAGGFHGGVLLAVEQGTMEDYEHIQFFFLEMDGKPVPFAVERIETKHGDMIVRFEDVNDVEGARKLQNKKVFVEKKHAVGEESDMMWTDLEGYTAVDEEAGSLGLILQVEEYPQQWIARCEVRDKEVLLPLNEDTIAEIDEEKKTVYFRLPEGLLKLYLGSEG